MVDTLSNLVTEDWLTNILAEKLQCEKLKVTDFTFEDGLEKGENYASSTVRIRVQYRTCPESEETQEIRLFSKCMPHQGAQREFLKKYELFEREICFYQKLLPEILSIASEKQIDLKKDYPEVVYANDELLVMVDLGFYNYCMGDRKLGMNSDEMRITLEAYARLHASSLYFAHLYTPEKLKEDFGLLYASDAMTSHTILQLYADPQSMRKTCKAMQEKYEATEPELVERLQAYSLIDNDAMLERNRRNFQVADQTSLKCFTMTDCWVNNMMFRYDESGRAKSVKLLDFQFARFGHALFDVAMLWYTSTTEEIFNDELMPMLSVYYQEFIKILTQLDTENITGLVGSYSFEQLRREFTVCEEAGFLVSISTLAVIMVTKDDFPESFEEQFVEGFQGLTDKVFNSNAKDDVLKRLLNRIRSGKMRFQMQSILILMAAAIINAQEQPETEGEDVEINVLPTDVKIEEVPIPVPDAPPAITYEPTWESLDSRPIPDWYDKGKIGVMVHWGVYSVPGVGSEWFLWSWQGDFMYGIRQNSGMKAGVYYSLYEWFNPLYLMDKNANFNSAFYPATKSMPELKDLVERYAPDMVWLTGDWEAPPYYWNSTAFLAWLYNESPVRNNVVVNDRLGTGTGCKHGGVLNCGDKFNPGTLQPKKWENVLSMDKFSWGHRRNSHVWDFMDVKQIVKSLIETVSCGGNLLINVGATGDGMINPIYEDRFLSLGKWLDVNGEAIYATVPWSTQNDTLAPTVWYTKRTLENPEEGFIYALFTKYPVGSITLAAPKPSTDTQAILLGHGQVEWVETDNGLQVSLPPLQLVKAPPHGWSLRFSRLKNFSGESV
ncbi:unnamed protein product [Notodromas monacha]|uniref:alpha-L-fucosidase n=1 Tax=Notodromas monacha TaxID=399045 RepID=A0A7R9BGQ6_9CRUS|nr:unnamed protein product [Notodromas monacha]CAG0915163.1 unnamed protein product [Notodromas monacha]